MLKAQQKAYLYFMIINQSADPPLIIPAHR
jgi:hypothetical protein